MITIISGVPGTGKTALLIEMIMEELKQGRKIFTLGIPQLLLNVREGGNAHTWQDGTWLEIDKYNPALCKEKGIASEWFPRGCKVDCQFLATCPRIGQERKDAGSLVIIDESHTSFPQRASGKAPPPYVEALTVHRHQGLDFWFVSQRPSFLDPFVRGLSSRHIHLSLNAFSFTGSRNKYQWAEYQETVNRTSKALAAKSDYKPSPAVFPLYASASVHTKLDQRMPTILKMFLIACGVLFLIGGFAVQRVRARVMDIREAESVRPSKLVTNAQQLPVSAVIAASSALEVGVLSVVSGVSPVHSLGQSDRSPERPLAVLKLAHGVYGDNPVEPPHYTEAELNNQARNVQILELAARQRIYNATVEVAFEDRINR